MRKEEMNCKEICELLMAYLDGEVSQQEKVYIETHLPECPQCHAELEALSATQSGLRVMLKSMAEEATPSTEAWKKVRVRLEKKGSWFEGFQRLFTGKAWQAAAVTAVVFVIAVVAAIWQFGGVGQAPPPAPSPAPAPTPAPAPAPMPTPAPGPTIYIEAEASLNKGTYLSGEDVVIEFSFKNVTSETFQIDPFPPLIQISHRSEVLRSFSPGETIKSLDPDEVATYTLTWNQKDEQGQQVPSGNYYIKLGDIKLGDRTMSLHLSGTRQFLILPAEGVMEKTIEVNQSQTIDGITFSLQRLELTATGLKVYAFNTPPDYSLPQGPMLPPPQLMGLHAEAEYRVDDGTVKQAGLSGIRFLDDGMLHTWDNLDPIPGNAKELTFIITKLGDYEGPWEFREPLE